MNSTEPMFRIIISDGEALGGPLDMERPAGCGPWLHRLKNIGSAATVFTAIAVSSVVAASESLQEEPGSAVRAFCEAFVQRRGEANAQVLDAD